MCYALHPLSSSAPASPWLPSSHSFTTGLHPSTLRGIPVSWDRVEGCIYVLPFSLTSSLFSSLLESCLLCLISCAWRSLALVLYGGHPYRSASLLLSLVPEGSFPGVCTGLLQRPNFTAHLIHIPLDCRLHQCVITVAQVKV